MITQNFTLSNTEERKTKTEWIFNPGLALIRLSGTGPWLIEGPIEMVPAFLYSF